MKKIVLLGFVAILSFSSFAQKVEGVAYYIESIDMTKPIEEMNKNLDSAKNADPERAARMNGMQKGLTEFMKSFERTETELYFTPNESFYQEREKELTEDEVNGEQNMFMRWKPENDKVYKTIEEDKTVTTKDFMGKKFLVHDTVKDYQWKVTGKSKMIQDYMCMQATYTDDTLMNVEAWFTPQIPVSIGPRNYGGLPGLIVELVIKPIKDSTETEEPKSSGRGGMRQMRMMMNHMQSNFTITLEKIEFREIKNKEIKEPTKGEVVEGGEAAYNKLMMDKVKEMQEQGGGRGGYRRH